MEDKEPYTHPSKKRKTDELDLNFSFLDLNPVKKMKNEEDSQREKRKEYEEEEDEEALLEEFNEICDLPKDWMLLNKVRPENEESSKMNEESEGLDALT